MGEMMRGLQWASWGTGFTFLMTVLGAALVYCFRGGISRGVQRLCLGFAAGVMIAASIWSLLIPAMERSEAMGLPSWLPAAVGFSLGAGFLLGLDHWMPHLHSLLGAVPEGFQRTSLLVLAVTLHNIPEGMAVGLSFALAAQAEGEFAAAAALALGIGIQNFPEGAAIALPLRQEGMTRRRAFLLGSASGLVEPIFGVLAVLAAGAAGVLMPWLLSFAAGAMLFVVVEELVPEANQPPHSDLGTLGAMVGFLMMMLLDTLF